MAIDNPAAGYDGVNFDAINNRNKITATKKDSTEMDYKISVAKEQYPEGLPDEVRAELYMDIVNRKFSEAEFERLFDRLYEW